MKDFLQRFNAMVDELKSHPNVQVISHHVPEPATEQEISEVENHLGKQLDDDIKNLYLQCNGLQLRWMRKSSSYFKPKEYGKFVEGPFTVDDILDDGMGMDGCVNLLPIKEVFLVDTITKFGKHPYTKEDAIFSIDGKGITCKEFSKKIKVFDFFNQEFDAAIIHWEQNDFIIRGSQIHRVFEDSRSTSIHAYLELLIRSYGDINARMDFFDGTRMVSFLTQVDLDAIKAFAPKL